ncbi:hypothetical protein GOP47_0022962 [Adiantum capillus-veneris]|uniref:Nitroreductase domain-containing protein n=1 Tax=Adiantum capillus-veneris TaxID=13818 RepID=A0A9D4Z4T1_ADICA|nr:hypothetical protein GOP47_0022962 [Adiantum capillus-veneris]
MAASHPSSLSAQNPVSSSSSATAPAFNLPDVETVISYHDRTKHFFTKYADGPHGLDWANQPNPFRRYTGSVDVTPLSKATLSQILYHSFALSAWKSSGFSTWGLRVNPSSGNLHPTEAYVVSDAIKAWKYGERAFRYCNHDVGHALGAISVAGAGLGWDAILLDGWGSDDLDCLLGVYGRKSIPTGSPRKGRYPELEQEHADCLVACFPRYHIASDEPVRNVLNAVVPSEALVQMANARMAQLKWMGTPNKLSKDHVWWQIIDKAAAVSRKPTTPVQLAINPWPSQGGMDVYKSYTLWKVITKRRSAVNMDMSQSMSIDAFYQILLKSLPSGPSMELQAENTQVPFRILPSSAEVHMAIFVHRVIGLPKGLYILVRNPSHEQRLRQALRQDFMWEKPPKCPETLRFYKLAEANCEKLAMQVSCFQEIAGFGCFSLGMIARFESIKERGPWMYPRLFWESGVLGQLLYLEAHAIGISATGIGCYFDDTVHEILGLKVVKSCPGIACLNRAARRNEVFSRSHAGFCSIEAEVSRDGNVPLLFVKARQSKIRRLQGYLPIESQNKASTVSQEEMKLCWVL